MSEAIYIRASTENNGLELARRVWQVQSPDHTRPPGVITNYLWNPVVHPGEPPFEHLAGRVRVTIHAHNFWVHREADPHIMDALIQPFVDSGDVTPEELTAIQDAIRKNAGNYLEDTDVFVPQFWLQTGLTAAQMEAEGWWGSPE